MSKHQDYEVCLKIQPNTKDKYIDMLLTSLARLGYNVYLGYDQDCVCFTTNDKEVTPTIGV